MSAGANRWAPLFVAACVVPLTAASPADAADVTGIRAVHRHGQTFVTWKDAGEGEASKTFRYDVYRSDGPITVENLDRAERCHRGVLWNSAKLYGSAFNEADRLDPAKPYATIVEGGAPLPPWSGLAVRTARQAGRSYYAVVATGSDGAPASAIVPGASATTEPVDETPGPIRPIKLWDSAERTGPYVGSTQLTGKTGLPVHVTLHGSQSGGGGAGDYGDYWLYFGTPEMGWRDGLPGVFSVTEVRRPAGNRLVVRLRDALEHPDGRRAMETYWFGYLCLPHGATHAEPRVHPFTERQIEWIVRWVAEHYRADAERVTLGGRSSGAVGSNNVGFRHPELFAAVFPVCGRVRRVPAVALDGRFDRAAGALMADGTPYYDRVDGPKFAAEHPEDLPFLGWACGRRDGWATWPEHIDMVKALTTARHGFAFSWNDGDHSSGGRAMDLIDRYYPADRFARNLSYPAFGNSSLDDDLGPGDADAGAPVGGINLGFRWTDPTDERDRWSIRLQNDLAKSPMTVDVTPRRAQAFRPKPGETLRWTNSAGGSGTVQADPRGLVTVEKLRLDAGRESVLTIAR